MKIIYKQFAVQTRGTAESNYTFERSAIRVLSLRVTRNIDYTPT